MDEPLGTSYGPSIRRIKARNSVTTLAQKGHPLRGLGTGNPISGNRALGNQTITFDSSMVGKTFDYECAVHGIVWYEGLN